MKISKLFVILVTLTFTQACKDIGITDIDFAQEIMVRGNYLTIEWDNPFFIEEANKIKTYRIFIRSHGTYGWTFVSGKAYSEQTSFTIEKGDLRSGKYDIGVAIVTTDGEMTAIHSSLDNTAIPQTGWYIFWIMD
ncbi:MAG: hypothetical protein ACOWWR_06025 [Eubacteriales bacterium]